MPQRDRPGGSATHRSGAYKEPRRLGHSAVYKAWNHEHSLAPPRGCHVKLDEKQELISWENKQLRVENVGLGADWAPSIEWKSNLNDLAEDVSAQYQCELVLQRLGVKFGFRYVQVYAVPHRTMAVWDRDRDEADGRFYQRLWPAGNHITVRFGFGPDHCSVHGHIFLTEAGDAQELLRDRNGPEQSQEPPWKEFFSRPRMSPQSPLHCAAANGYAEMASALVQAANSAWPEFIDAKDPNGDTAIHIAAENGRLDVVKLLVDSGCFKGAPSGYFYWTSEFWGDNPHSQYWQIWTETLSAIIHDIVPGTMEVAEGYHLVESSPRFAIDALGLPILNGHEAIAGYLLDHHGQAFAADWHIMSPLHLAALAGQYAILERMLVEGSSPNLRCPQFHNAPPSHMAAATKNGAAILELLRKHGANLDQLDDNRRPPLQWAVDHDTINSAMSLIKLGIQLKSVTMVACMRRDNWWSCTELILETVQKSPAVLSDGEYTLKQCTQSLISSCRADSENLKTVERIIKKRIGLGAIDPRLYRNPSCGESEGLSSLHVAAISDGFPEHLFKLLLEQRPVDINSRDPEGHTPLDDAVLRNKAWKVELIREHGGRAAHELADEK
ncbi:hypothetical protein DL766_007719 [Monosporascus sp. MC13-8B]|nr:hypothetical protein DL766_007719 [Monosporascus sp. MC13-8B]